MIHFQNLPSLIALKTCQDSAGDAARSMGCMGLQAGRASPPLPSHRACDGPMRLVVYQHSLFLYESKVNYICIMAALSWQNLPLSASVLASFLAASILMFLRGFIMTQAAEHVKQVAHQNRLGERAQDAFSGASRTMLFPPMDRMDSQGCWHFSTLIHLHLFCGD